MAYLDIPYLVEADGGKVKGYKLFGTLVDEVDMSRHNFTNAGMQTSNLRYALIDLLGVESPSGTRYFALGRVVVVVDNKWLTEARTKASKRLGVVVSGGTLAVLQNGLTVMFQYKKGNMNEWILMGSNVSKLNTNEHGVLVGIMLEGYKNNWNFPMPESLPSRYAVASDGVDISLVSNSVSGSPVYNTPESIPLVDPTSLITKAPENLGTSQSSNIGTLISNKESSLEPSKIIPKNKVEYRDKVGDLSDKVEMMDDLLKEAYSKVELVVNNSAIMVDDNDAEEYDLWTSRIKATADKLAKSWTSKVGFFTGRALFKVACERVLDEKHVTGKLDSALSTYGVELLKIWAGEDSPAFNKSDSILTDILINDKKLYVTILETVLSISKESLVRTLDACEDQEVSFLRILDTNPYIFSFVDPSTSLITLDKLAMYQGVDITSEEVRSARNTAYLHEIMLDYNHFLIDSSTAIVKSKLQSSVKSGVTLTKALYDLLVASGHIVQPDRLDSMLFFIKGNGEKTNFTLPIKKTDWRPIGKTRMHLSDGKDAKDVVQDYIDSGFGIVFEVDKKEYISDYVNIEKELFIYKTFHEMASNGVTTLDEEKVKDVVDNFQIMKDKELNLPLGTFKLEERQSQGVILLNNNVMVLTGPAGSGKTTTAELLVYAVQELHNVMDDDIYFAAPTGKAAARLREVVKRKTSTTSSLFRINTEGNGLRKKKAKQRDDIRVLVLDESSMLNLHVMYEMACKLSHETLVIFLGDIEQLPPIGFGKPFANLLSFLPCVHLNVTKRASESSTNTKNAKRLISESEGVATPLEDGADCRLLHTLDEQKAVNAVVRLIKYHMLGEPLPAGFEPITSIQGKVSPDDIQVITPINGRIWGTASLNIQLREIFNPMTPNKISINYKKGNETHEFRVGDRVIHTNKNIKDVERFIKEGNSFINVKQSGISNGDVGKIEGIYEAKDLDIQYPQVDALSDEESKHPYMTEGVWLLAMEIEDVDIETGLPEKFIVFYPLMLLSRYGNKLEVTSNSLVNLDLAYALTVHKMQGSQAKLTFSLVLSLGSGSFASKFISRNLLYTMTTRVSDGQYIIGDIKGTTSTLAKGRKVEQNALRKTALDLIV